jgi:sugar phosphate isomerase/epimerase
VLQFIIGQKSLDEWDSFVSTLYDMGIDTAIEVKQAAYDDYLAS